MKIAIEAGIYLNKSNGKWIHLAHTPGPRKTNTFIPIPKKNLYLPKNINFSNKKSFCTCLKEVILWHPHQAQLKKINFYPKNFLCFLKYQFFKRKLKIYIRLKPSLPKNETSTKKN